MRSLREFIAALVLVAWLAAGVHVTIEHGCDPFELSGDASASGANHVDLGDGPENSDEHFHDLGAITATLSAAPGQRLSRAEFTSVSHGSAGVIALIHSQANGLGPVWTNGDSPPDQRSFGWLFVVQTALQVRGPSLSA